MRVGSCAERCANSALLVPSPRLAVQAVCYLWRRLSSTRAGEQVGAWAAAELGVWHTGSRF